MNRPLLAALAVAALLPRALEAQICPPEPPACRTAANASLTLRFKPDPTNDRITWKWQRGEETSVADYFNPVNNTDYAFCLYAGTPAALLAELVAPHGSDAWVNYGPSVVTGYRYRNPGDGGGIQTIVLRPGTGGRARITLQARGAIPAVALPIAAADLPLVAQLHKSDAAPCWETRFAAPRSNDATTFRALLP